MDSLIAGEGRRLEPSTERAMEDAYGRDLSGVRIHTDDQAAAVARAQGAQALTVGSHIVFGPDRYAPGTKHGHRLLAHEIAHVVQQGRAEGAAGSTRAAEAEADRAAGATLVGATPSVALSMPAGVQCQEEEEEEEGFFEAAGSWLEEKKDQAVEAAESAIDDPVGTLEAVTSKVENVATDALDAAGEAIDDPVGTLEAAASKVEGAFEGAVEAANEMELTGFAKGAVDNLYKRGEALVEAAPALAETAFILNPITGPSALVIASNLHPEGIEGVWNDVSSTVSGVVGGVPHVIETTGNAFGTLAYGVANPTEEGIDEKMGSAFVDAILGIADLALMGEGFKNFAEGMGGKVKPTPAPEAPVKPAAPDVKPTPAPEAPVKPAAPDVKPTPAPEAPVKPAAPDVKPSAPEPTAPTPEGPPSAVPEAPTPAAGPEPPKPGGPPPDVKPDVYTNQLFREKVTGPPVSSKSRGYKPKSKKFDTLKDRALRHWGEPGPKPTKAELDLGHRGRPHSTLPPGEQSTLTPQRASENRSAGAGPEKRIAQERRQKSAQQGLDPHDPKANPRYFTRPKTKRKPRKKKK